MPLIWIFMLIVCSVYAFTPRETMAQYLPLAETTGGWIVGIVVLFIGTILLLLVFNIIEEVGRKRNEHGSAAIGHDNHH